MNDQCPKQFKYPSTRYSGSKRRLLTWLWSHLSKVDFNSALDVFGGTGSVSLMLKVYGKKVHYNDLLQSNQIVGKALIENKEIRITDKDLALVFDIHLQDNPDFIQSEFDGIFFTRAENMFLDQFVYNVSQLIDDPYKQAIILSCLFQACLSKRPYNLFHRANLYMRLADVERSFGNKVTWEKTFPELIRYYAKEYNDAIFDNQQENKVIGGEHALTAPNGVDLVYLDPPYFSQASSTGTNYLDYYHFLEGLADYHNWQRRIDFSKKHKPIHGLDGILDFTSKARIYASFETLLTRYQKNIIALSYRSDGIPKPEEIREILAGLGKKVDIYEQVHKYALSSSVSKELLFIAC